MRGGGGDFYAPTVETMHELFNLMNHVDFLNCWVITRKELFCPSTPLPGFTYDLGK